MLGDAETHDRIVREIVTGAEVTVVFVEYARSPQARYPIATEQAYAATAWVAEHGAELGVDASRLAVAGDSTGGTLATVTTLLAKERGGPPIDFQVLLYPVTDANFETPSYREFGAGGYWLTREAMHWFWENYVPAPERQEFTVSPLRASLEQLRGLPPALIITCECDVVRDEGEAYAQRLMAAGVPVRAACYLGAIHDLVLLNPIAGTPAARAALAQVTDTLRTVFARNSLSESNPSDRHPSQEDHGPVEEYRSPSSREQKGENHERLNDLWNPALGGGHREPTQPVCGRADAGAPEEGHREPQADPFCPD
jgi:acetyl esterase